MWLPGLTCCGSRIQPASVPAVAERARSDALTAREVGEVGPHAAEAFVPWMLWQYTQAEPSSTCWPCSSSAFAGGGAGRCWLASHAVELRRRLRDHVEGHVRVLQAAELGALAAEDAGAVGLEHHVVRLPRDHVDLPVQLRHPERVDHVVGPSARR